MCFYLYAPKYSIELKYVNETIKLLSNGSSEVVTEILIENNSPEELKEVNIIYPNSFLKPRKQFQEFDHVGVFENRTSELRQKTIPQNYHYTRDQNKVFEVIGNYVTIGDKKSDKIYKGQAIDTKKDALMLHDQNSKFLKYEDILILFFGMGHKRFNVFTFTFETPLSQNEKRWIRLCFKPESTTMVPLKWYNKQSARYLYNAGLNYNVFGPDNVRNFIEEHLTALESIDKKAIGNIEDRYSNTIEAFQADLKSKLLDEGISKTSIKINDWRIAIATDGFKVRIFNIAPQGSIECAEPYSYPYYDKSNSVGISYHFRAGKIYSKEDAKFILNIVAETMPKITSYTIPFVLFFFIIIEVAIFNTKPILGIAGLLIPPFFFFITKWVKECIK